MSTIVEGDREVVLRRLRGALPQLKRQFPLRRLALFGSMARNEPGARDVDVLADVEPSIGLDFVTLAESIEALIGRKVDLVSARGLKPALRPHIDRDLIDVETGA